MKKSQQGIGLMEVLVALLILAIAILGFAALQLRAVNASIEAGNNIHATNIARDLTERMRINRAGIARYANFNRHTDVTTPSTACDTEACAAAALADYDINHARYKATQAGMKIAVLPCQASNFRRMCVYVAWANTEPTNGTRLGTADNPTKDCTNGKIYVPNAECIIMEAYNDQ